MLLLVKPLFLLPSGHSAMTTMLGRPRPEVRRLVDLDRGVLFGFAHNRSVPRLAVLTPRSPGSGWHDGRTEP